MLAVNYSTLRNSLKSYCDKACDESEVIVVTRKGEKNVVLMSVKDYNDMQKRLHNKEYMEMLEKAIRDIRDGKIVAKDLSFFKWDA